MVARGGRARVGMSDGSGLLQHLDEGARSRPRDARVCDDTDRHPLHPEEPQGPHARAGSGSPDATQERGDAAGCNRDAARGHRAGGVRAVAEPIARARRAAGRTRDRGGRRRSSAALAALLPMQLFCTVALSEARAKQLIVFMGDGGCMVLGTLLMLSVYAPEESALKRGWLRWGFLVIGAAAFADAFAQWWASRTDFDRIPFGMNEGAGLSDPSVLSQTYFWSTDQIVRRYVALGCVCLAVLAVSSALGLLRQRRAW